MITDLKATVTLEAGHAAAHVCLEIDQGIVTIIPRDNTARRVMPKEKASNING